MMVAALHTQDAVGKLQLLLDGATGHLRDALNEAIAYVQCGMPVPADLVGIITKATAFNQDKYGK